MNDWGEKKKKKTPLIFRISGLFDLVTPMVTVVTASADDYCENSMICSCSVRIDLYTFLSYDRIEKH